MRIPMAAILVCVIFVMRSFVSASLVQGRWTPLRLGSILPEGWLRRQLEIQADGMSGFIDHYWSDVSESGWLGGWAEGWERFPYFMDGFFALAVLSRNDSLLKRAEAHFDYIEAHQSAEGWYGPWKPRGNLGRGFYPTHDPWPQFAILKGLVQRHQHNQNATLLEGMIKSCHMINKFLEGGQLLLYPWANYRIMDFVWVLEYLTDCTGDPKLEAMAKKWAEPYAFDWFKHFRDFEKCCTQKQLHVLDTYSVHGVNNAQAIKFPAVRWRVDGLPKTKAALADWIGKLQRYHGTATGLFHGDELYGGLSPTQGKFMFSLEISQMVFGDVWIGDLLEQVAFNNLPGQLNTAMTLHQYVCQDNQVEVKRAGRTNFTDVGEYGNLYGVSPNYGCCTANVRHDNRVVGSLTVAQYHQGWPKLVEHLWGTRDASIALLVLSPSTVTAEIGGAQVTLRSVTDYPFGDGSLSIDVLDVAPDEKSFEICLRIPGWIKPAEVDVLVSSSQGRKTLRAAANTMFCVQEAWKKGNFISIQLPMNLRRSPYSYHNSLSVFRGPLLLAKRIKARDPKLIRRCPVPIDKKTCEDYYDHELSPEEAWNYGLHVDPTTLSGISVSLGPVSQFPFSRSSRAVIAHAQGQQIPAWKLDNTFNIAGEVPYSPVAASRNPASSETVDLQPIGSTDLRLSVFPWFGK